MLDSKQLAYVLVVCLLIMAALVHEVAGEELPVDSSAVQTIVFEEADIDTINEVSVNPYIKALASEYGVDEVNLDEIKIKAILNAITVVDMPVELK